MREALTGSRIRERRVIAGIKQAELARDIGISASYLNLIEHNRRKIGGKLLLKIATRLSVEPQSLTEGAEATLIASLRAAAADVGIANAEITRVEEFAGRFPSWAETLARMRAHVQTLNEKVEALNDRLSHDPHLAASMHDLLSTATAIRSTAAILTETDTLKPEWRARFQSNLHEDSRRLSDSAQALVMYFEGKNAAPPTAQSPLEELTQFLAEESDTFVDLDVSSVSAEAITERLAAAPSLRSDTAHQWARKIVLEAHEDAQKLPLRRLRARIDARGPDILMLARALDVPVAVLLRRLAALPELNAGLVSCDRQGTVLVRKTVEGMPSANRGDSALFRPLFQAMGQPGAVVTSRIGPLGRGRSFFDATAFCEIGKPRAYNAQPALQSIMLMLPEPAAQVP